MNRYFIEVSYLGTAYSGFQVQQNASTIQAEVARALAIYFRREINLTGSSRTDTGVHAFQNYFHFDLEGMVGDGIEYNINALLPEDIAVRSIRKVGPDAHCRFDALSRQYRYIIYSQKDPFLRGRACYYPYSIDLELMQQAAEKLKEHTDYRSFSKRNSQVRTFNCSIIESEWIEEKGNKIYRVRANRFLRGMVRGLVGTMLQVGRQKISVSEFTAIIENGDSSEVDFSVPGCGLYLEKVIFSEDYFEW